MRRLLLIIGLVILAFLVFFCTRGNAPEIQSDILSRTTTNLAAENMNWANVSVDGRNIILTGVAPSESEKEKAASIASSVEGVSSVDNQMSVMEIGLPSDTGTTTQFVFDNGQLTLSGLVPDEAAKTELVAQSKSMFRSVSVVDELVVNSESMLAGWKETALVALTQLGEFSKGSITINGDKIDISGVVDSKASSDYVRKSLDSVLNGQFVVNYDINIENLSPPEPTHSHIVTPAVQTESHTEVVSCQARFDAALLGQFIRFKTNRAVIDTESNVLLNKLSEVAKSCPDTHIEIEGHTDSQGSDEYNMKLSQERAEAVLVYLIDKGVRADRLVAIGYGELKPIADNNTAAGRQQNRRIEFTVKGK